MDIMIDKAFSVTAMEWIAPSKNLYVRKCNSRNCLCCRSLNTDNIFRSFSTGCRFTVDKPVVDGFFSCKSKYVIYLITCNDCGIQYVGQTRQSLHCRLNGHRSSMNNNNKSTFLYEHFRNEGHSFHNISIQIIDSVSLDEISESEAKTQLDKKEDFYIKTLNTLFPLGLNDKLLGGGCASQKSATDFSFFHYPVRRRPRERGIRKSGRKRMNNDEDFFNNLMKELAELFQNKKLQLFYQKLKSLTKSKLKKLHSLLVDKADNMTFIISAFIQNACKVQHRRDEDRESIVIPFNCRNIDLINIPSILNDKKVCQLLPDAVKDNYPPKIFFKLNNPIALRLCNYSKFLNRLNMDGVNDIMHGQCVCSKFPSFIYAPFGHVLTGSVEIIQDNRLKELLQYGTKYRISSWLPWRKVVKEIKVILNEHIDKVCRKFNIEVITFSEWRNKVNKIIHNRVFRLKKSYRAPDDKFLNFRFDKSLYKSIEILQKDFIICPVDKAAGNFAFVCKKFYVEVLLKELGFDFNMLSAIGNVTYSPVEESIDTVIKRHVEDIKKGFSINCPEEDTRLPKLFWVPKFHKMPFKFRFIAGASRCTTKKLSVLVNKGLSVIRENFQRYCIAISKNSGFNCYWSVNCTTAFLDKLKLTSVYSVQTFDFSTLYTNLDQQQIEFHLNQVVDLVFNSSNRKFLCIGWEKSFFSAKCYRGYRCFEIEQFKAAIRYILSEVYVSFGGLLFRQSRGIPMGGNCSPLLADLFLSHCEFVYMNKLIKDKKFGLAKLLSFNSRYIDDICVINYKDFETRIPIIYPSDLIAERCGNDIHNAVYLDTRISISQGNLRTSVYHKVDDFNFEVVLLTFPSSLIPLSMGLNVFAGQVLRYLRICSHLHDVVDKTNKTLLLLKSRGYESRKLKIFCERLISKHNEALFKFGLYSARQFTSQCEF